jgi:hypothetical protein
VVPEATYGWYWAADLLQACGARVHLTHPPPATRSTWLNCCACTDSPSGGQFDYSAGHYRSNIVFFAALRT